METIFHEPPKLRSRNYCPRHIRLHARHGAVPRRHPPDGWWADRFTGCVQPGGDWQGSVILDAFSAPFRTASAGAGRCSHRERGFVTMAYSSNSQLSECLGSVKGKCLRCRGAPGLDLELALSAGRRKAGKAGVQKAIRRIAARDLRCRLTRGLRCPQAPPKPSFKGYELRVGGELARRFHRQCDQDQTPEGVPTSRLARFHPRSAASRWFAGRSGKQAQRSCLPVESAASFATANPFPLRTWRRTLGIVDGSAASRSG